MNADASEFAQFIKARGQALQRTAWLLTGDWGLAEDLVQTALARSWPRWERINRRDDPEVYVRRVMINTWRTWSRRNTAGKPFKLVTEGGVIAFSADGKTAFVLTPGRNLAVNLVPISTLTSTPGTQISLGRFDGIALSPDGTTAYVGTKNKITPVSTITGRQGTSIALPGNPFEMAVTPDGKTIVVAIEHGHTMATITAKVFLISTRTGKVSQPIPIPPAAEEIVFTPDSKVAYFASSEGPGRGATPVSITTGTAGKTVHIGRDAQIAMTPDGRTLYATNTQGVIPVDVATDTAGPLIPSPVRGIIQEIGISP